jgi:hypothetical protein
MIKVLQKGSSRALSLLLNAERLDRHDHWWETLLTVVNQTGNFDPHSHQARKCTHALHEPFGAGSPVFAP